MSTYYAMDASSSLSHHGILGMKWGIRRYQNADGSLTDAGKKRYLNSDLSGEKTYKSLKKAVQNKRGIQEGQANRWMSGTPIGKHSKQLRDEALADEKRLKSSKEYKEWKKKYDKFESDSGKAYDKGKLDMDAYDKKQHELYESRPKSKVDSLRGAVRYGNKGREYINNFLNEGGRDISLAYLRDLGFDSKEAEYLVQKMIKENRTLGMI